MLIDFGRCAGCFSDVFVSVADRRWWFVRVGWISLYVLVIVGVFVVKGTGHSLHRGEVALVVSSELGSGSGPDGYM